MRRCSGSRSTTARGSAATTFIAGHQLSPYVVPWVLAVVATLEVMRVSMMRFSQKLVAELFQPFWAAWQAGEFMTDAAAVAGTYRQRGLAWVRESGGVRPRRGRDLAGRYLSFAKREKIAFPSECSNCAEAPSVACRK